MTRHEELLDQYARELRSAKARAERWWATLRSTGSGSERSLTERWPDGPASHPWVLAVIRKYWFRCEALNQQVIQEESTGQEVLEREYVVATEEEEDETRPQAGDDDETEDEVYPQIFVLEWLMTPENDDLATFLGALTYWPIGLDKDDNYT